MEHLSEVGKRVERLLYSSVIIILASFFFYFLSSAITLDNNGLKKTMLTGFIEGINERRESLDIAKVLQEKYKQYVDDNKKKTDAQKKEEEGRNYIIGGLELNEDTIEFSVDGNPVKLTPIEFKILALLMKNPGRVFSAEEIYERVWNEKAINTDTIMVHVRNIRDKIEINPREPKYLKVVWGVGYKIEKQP